MKHLHHLMFAVLMIGDGCDIEPSNRNILLRQREGGLQKISELHPSYDPLHYVLLFPRGDNGWHPDIPLLRSCRCQYMQEDSANNIGQHIILPSTFSGGPQQMYQLYQDAIAIVHHFGKPDLFITFTCNPKWPEITRELLPNQTAADRPDLTARVFNMKLREMMKDLVKDIGLEKLLLIFIKIRSIEKYDLFVSAEIPDYELNPSAYENCNNYDDAWSMWYTKYIIPMYEKMANVKKHYPKIFQETTQEGPNGYPLYRRKNNGCYIGNSIKTTDGLCLIISN
ncbi:unnamed protein product [Rhizophagus irregularis]|nr:unnamed protein product [Rhizophagus irregularis]